VSFPPAPSPVLYRQPVFLTVCQVLERTAFRRTYLSRPP
jgi:hypothetical protein